MYFLYGNGNSVGTSALAELVEGMGHLGPEQRLGDKGICSRKPELLLNLRIIIG